MTTPGGPPVVGLVVERRHLAAAALVEACHSWRGSGWDVDVVVPADDHAYELPARSPAWSVVVSRGRHPAGLGLLAAAAALGVPAVNTPEAVERVRNKVAMHAILAHHDIPTPRTWFARAIPAFSSLPADAFPLVVKPADGDGGSGLALLTRPADAGRLPGAGRRLWLAQEYLPTDGHDLKLYGIGPHLWAVRKPSPVRLDGPGPATAVDHDGGSVPVPLDDELADIARTCGRACGLELWGVDVAMTPRGPVVIEVNDFPTYSAVPDAGTAIAEHVATLLATHAVARRAGRDHYRSLVRGPG